MISFHIKTVFCLLQDIPKIDLLELVLVHLRAQAKWSRIAMEYGDQLQDVKAILEAKSN